MGAFTAFVGGCGPTLSVHHRAAALPLLTKADNVLDALSPRRAARLLDDAEHCVALAFLDDACVGASIFRPATSQLLLIACADQEAVRRKGLGSSLVHLVEHVCVRHSKNAEQLWTLAPRDMPPATRKFLRAVGFTGLREPPSAAASAAHPWKQAAELSTLARPLPSEADQECPQATAMLKSTSRRLCDRSGARGGRESDEKDEPAAGASDGINLESVPALPEIGSIIALWVSLDRCFYPALVRDRSMVLGKRAGQGSYSLHVQYLQQLSAARDRPPPQREEKAVDGMTLVATQPIDDEETRRVAPRQRPWYFVASPPESVDWQRIVAGVCPTRSGDAPCTEPSSGPSPAAPQPITTAKRRGASAAPAAVDACDAMPAAACRASRSGAHVEDPIAPVGAVGQGGGGDGERKRGKRVVLHDVPPSSAQSSSVRSEGVHKVSKGKALLSSEGGAGPCTRRPPFTVHSPPLPPTPESPAKPAWWRDEEDDVRAAELLYTLFAGDVGAGLSKDIDEWVVRDTSVAAEAFPEVPFWRGLDIRWLQYSYARAGVGEALRKLKASFAKGEGRLRFVSVDNGRQKRSRAGEKREARHPVHELGAAGREHV